MKIAIVHDWLSTYAGAESVLAQIIACYPHADVYTLVDYLTPKERGLLKAKSITTSFVQKIPFMRQKYRLFINLFTYAIEQFDLSQYDLIISSSHAVAKGVLTGPNQLHICYCHSPMRYAWDLQHQYLNESGLNKGIKSIVARFMLHKLRLWDYRTANGVDYFIANSKFIANRINKIYRRQATVIYPGINLTKYASNANRKKNYFLAVSRLVPYKKMALIAEAFKLMPDRQLIMIGSGPEQKKIERLIANTANITFLGYQPENTLIDYLQQAQALVFAAEEDFGIISIEAQACGTPVIAYAKGGNLETVINIDQINPTGVLFTEQTTASICQAVTTFRQQQHLITSSSCISNAQKFSNDEFKEKLTHFVKDKLHDFQLQN
ncbi:MAG: glycosyltransferase [Burkholderiales bacterium]|nr:glycosyltransferase [Burkholderiales bacterium]